MDSRQFNQTYQVEYLLDNMASIPSNNITLSLEHNKTQDMGHQISIINIGEWHLDIQLNNHILTDQEQDILLQVIHRGLHLIREVYLQVRECQEHTHLLTTK